MTWAINWDKVGLASKLTGIKSNNNQPCKGLIATHGQSNKYLNLYQ